jgi:hypothetical protein
MGYRPKPPEDWGATLNGDVSPVAPPPPPNEGSSRRRFPTDQGVSLSGGPPTPPPLRMIKDTPDGPWVWFCIGYSFGVLTCIAFLWLAMKLTPVPTP